MSSTLTWWYNAGYFQLSIEGNYVSKDCYGKDISIWNSPILMILWSFAELMARQDNISCISDVNIVKCSRYVANMGVIIIAPMALILIIDPYCKIRI